MKSLDRVAEWLRPLVLPFAYMIPYVPAERMTSRARMYLAIVAFYALGIAIGGWAEPDRFGSASFNLIKGAVPGGLFTWSVIHTMVAAVAIKAFWHGDEDWARGALISAAAVVGMWDVNFIVNYFLESKAAPTAPVVYTAMMLTHIVQARLPIRSPFEPVLPPIADE